MTKKIIGSLALVIIIGVLVFGAVNRSLAKINSGSIGESEGDYVTFVESRKENTPGTENPVSVAETDQHSQQVELLPKSEAELTEEEIAGLLYMREEEKLAQDVYIYFYELFGSQNFQNIGQSESTHMDAVNVLLDRYGLADPASTEPGIFTKMVLQDLYNQMIDRGSQSLGDALKVGAAIEEMDILDLQHQMALTEKLDIQQVYQSLLDGSGNHLRAFVAKLNKETGETYVPQYLDLATYQNLVSVSLQGSGNGQGAGSDYGQGAGKGNGGNGGGIP